MSQRRSKNDWPKEEFPSQQQQYSQKAAKEPDTVPIKIQVEVVSPPNEPLPQEQQIPNIRCNCFDWSAILHLRSQSLHQNLDVGLFGII